MSEPTWYGHHQLPHGGAWFWQLGPLRLYVENRQSEWRLGWRAERDHSLSTSESGEVSPERLSEGTSARFASRADEDSIALGAALADRPVVVRPETPVWLLGGEEVDFFLSTPLWIRVSTALTGRQLLDMPTFRPPDTWFGANTREGELAYASRTRAQREPMIHPFRAATRLTIINREPDAVRIERVQLPVPSLRLYLDADGRFWTSPVVLERTEAGFSGHLRILDTPPGEAHDARLVTEARVPFRAQLGIVRALTALWT